MMPASILEETQELHFRGFAICSGISIGKPFFFAKVEEPVPELVIADAAIDHEIARYYQALRNTREEIIIVRQSFPQKGNNEATAILNAYLEITHDPLMTIKIEEGIRAKKKNAEYVFKTVTGEYEKKFCKTIDPFFLERLNDFQDISHRLLSHLRKKQSSSLQSIEQPMIVFAEALSPTDVAEARTAFIEAFVTKSGAETSHVAIMARAKAIPFVSNVDFSDLPLPFSLVIVDGRSGDVIINPTTETIEHYKTERKKLKIHAARFKKTNRLAAKTIDGHEIKLSANIEMFDELDMAIQNGGEGIGLFRTENLFLAQGGFPSEEEQLHVYKNIVETLDGAPAIIRTFDIGGDKVGRFHQSRYEKNPYLGCRAIRLMLKEKEVFKTQIRAILRASAFGEVRILFPMISDLAELRAAKIVMEDAKCELHEKRMPFAPNIAVGCMIEVPSAALTSDILAKECDFLSIGTNDLVQYSLAVDRGNEAMSYLYNPMHPSILRLIKMVAEAGNRARTTVSICGEIAADPKFTELLLGLGVHELSVSSPALPLIKNVIRHLSILEATEFAKHVLTLSTTQEIQTALSKRCDDFYFL